MHQIGDQKGHREAERGQHAGAVRRNVAATNEHVAEDQADPGAGVEESIERRKQHARTHSTGWAPSAALKNTLGYWFSKAQLGKAPKVAAAATTRVPC